MEEVMSKYDEILRKFEESIKNCESLKNNCINAAKKIAEDFANFLDCDIKLIEVVDIENSKISKTVDELQDIIRYDQNKFWKFGIAINFNIRGKTPVMINKILFNLSLTDSDGLIIVKLDALEKEFNYLDEKNDLFNIIYNNAFNFVNDFDNLNMCHYPVLINIHSNDSQSKSDNSLPYAIRKNSH